MNRYNRVAFNIFKNKETNGKFDSWMKDCSKSLLLVTQSLTVKSPSFIELKDLRSVYLSGYQDFLCAVFHYFNQDFHDCIS